MLPSYSVLAQGCIAAVQVVVVVVAAAAAVAAAAGSVAVRPTATRDGDGRWATVDGGGSPLCCTELVKTRKKNNTYDRKSALPQSRPTVLLRLVSRLSLMQVRLRPCV